MYNNIPNIINCIKTGVYSEMDFNKRIADENGINLEIALLAADNCCFNMTKKEVISRLLYNTDLETIKPEIEEMLNSGIFSIEGRNLYINNGYNVSDAHEFFSDNSDGSAFFKYCLDYLTSWDACSLYYENDLCPSDIMESAYAIDLYVNEGKGPYKECAELMARNFSMKNLSNLESSVTKRSKLHIIYENNRYRYKYEVYDFLRDHNYDFNLAQKQFGWDRLQKYIWKKRHGHLKNMVYTIIEDGNMKFFNLHNDSDSYVYKEYEKNNRKIPDRILRAICMVDNRYPVIHGIPLLYPKERKIVFLDILRTFIIERKRLPGKEMEKLIKRTILLQNKLVKDLLDAESGNYVASLNLNEHKEILQTELNEVYNKLLYMYATDKDNTVDYTDDWISNCLDFIDKSGLGKYKLYTDTLATMKNSRLLLEPGKSFYDDQTWVEKLLIKTGAI